MYYTYIQIFAKDICYQINTADNSNNNYDDCINVLSKNLAEGIPANRGHPTF